jgi:hypothetical protein
MRQIGIGPVNEFTAAETAPIAPGVLVISALYLLSMGIILTIGE